MLPSNMFNAPEHFFRDTMQVKTHGQTILKRMKKGENVYKLLTDEYGENGDDVTANGGGYDYDTATNTMEEVKTEANSVLSNKNRSIPTKCTPLPMSRIDQNSRTKDYVYGSAYPLSYDSTRLRITEDSSKETRKDHRNYNATTHSLNAHNSHNDNYMMSSQHQHDNYGTCSQHNGYDVSEPIENATLRQQRVDQTSHSHQQSIGNGALATNAVDDAIIHMGSDVDFLESTSLPSKLGFENQSNFDIDYQNSTHGHQTSNDSSLLDNDPMVDPIEYDSPDASINLVEYNEWADDLAGISIHFPTSDTDFEAATAAHADSAAALFHDAIFHQRVSP